MAEGSNKRPSLARVLRRLRGSPFRLFRKAYLFLFARPRLQRLNARVLEVVARAHGYHNYGDFENTGEARFVELLAAHDPRLCLDIGANKGAYAALLLESTSAYVVSFEPLAEPFAVLTRLEQQYPGRFEAVNCGIGAEDARLPIYHGKSNTEWASFSLASKEIDYAATENTEVVNVPVKRLDTWFKDWAFGRGGRTLDLLKIDTEGYEYEVLCGASDTIARLRPKFVQIEYGPHQLFRSTSLYALSRLLPGYRAYQLLPFGRGLAPRDARSFDANIYRYSNFVFAREDVGRIT